MLGFFFVFAIELPEHLGYPLLAILVAGESAGLGLPGETGMVAAGILAHDGTMELGLVMLIGITAAIVGDNVGYLIGRHGGRRLLEHPGPFLEYRRRVLSEGEPFFEKHGAKAVFFGRWIPVVRVAAVWFAGINHMPWPRFIVWNALGGICWAVSVTLLGYFVGSAVIEWLHNAGFGAAGVVSIIVLLLIGRHLLHRRRRHRAAHSRAATSSPTEG